jgi:RNA-directed DNA polymerase
VAWQWARRRHPNKGPRWFKSKYFAQRGNWDWSFFGETCDDEGKPTKVWLYYAKSTPIKRHVKVKGEANPYDPAYETYFEEREGAHMLETFRGTRTLRYLWYEQRGLCTLCHTKITRITGWRLHHCVSRVMGGSACATNRVLLHPECHDRVHRQRLSVSKPRLL